jgi:imidazoleglycerol phosphate synthase glutamine amidotransferase subunit HisH
VAVRGERRSAGRARSRSAAGPDPAPRRQRGAAPEDPHVGWNALEFKKPARLLDGLEPGAQVYFTHSFAAPVTSACAAATTHANTFASAVEDGNVFGVQFHPRSRATPACRSSGIS